MILYCLIIIKLYFLRCDHKVHVLPTEFIYVLMYGIL